MPPKPVSQADVSQWISEGLTEAVAELRNGTTNNNNNGQAGCTYKAFLSCEPHSFNGTEGPVGLTRWFEKLESVLRISGCRDADRTKFASCKLSDGALTWWNTYANSVGMDQDFEIPWEDLKRRMIEEYCHYTETIKMERELQNLKLVGNNLASYNKRFFELALMCLYMVTPERRKIILYVKGLTENIQSGVTTSKPRTIQEAVEKRKWNNNNNSGKNFNQQPFKKQDTAKGNTATPNASSGYKGKLSLCAKCNRHHPGDYMKMCDKCKKNGHVAIKCRAGTNMCYGCRKESHFRKDCPTTSKTAEPARGRAFNINSNEAQLGNGNLISADKVYCGCTLTLAGMSFKIDVIPIKLRSFNLVVGMDWLAENRADIVCYQKAIRIPVIEGEPLMVYRERSNMPLHFINCLKVKKHMRKGYLAMLVHASKTESEGKKVEDVLIVREFPDVFSMSYPDYLHVEM
ncbi:uncharacterized protein [Rutidosis leptorrhynchoides]|uniref:uncharacterized protein n=1 Tax=Rutidosis leptorrhynchoides TaxID=125765 RepID=UPI003A9A405E